MNPLIISVARTPITQFASGAFANLPATKLGAVAIKAALERAKVQPEQVQEVFFGQVLQGGAGQAPARQASLGAGLNEAVICTTINKVCASGMKAIMIGAQSIRNGDSDLVIAGGMESMSQVPRFMKRSIPVYGNVELTDGILHDGLTDAYDHFHMGICAENTCKKMSITRQEQDDFAITSYKRSAEANQRGDLPKEIVPVEVPGKRGESPRIVSEDEEFKKIDFNRIPTLKPAFIKENGTVTAANASTLNDGAAATLIASPRTVDRLKLEPLAEIVGYADAACKPIDFPLAPALSIPKVSFETHADPRPLSMIHSKNMIESKLVPWEIEIHAHFSSGETYASFNSMALERLKLNVGDISRWEINEAFSAVVVANMKLLKLDHALVNINGGAVSLGHPIGMSGARIVNSLAMHLKSGQYGVASICNGGGGASTVIVKKL